MRKLDDDTEDTIRQVAVRAAGCGADDAAHLRSERPEWIPARFYDQLDEALGREALGPEVIFFENCFSRAYHRAYAFGLVAWAINPLRQLIDIESRQAVGPATPSQALAFLQALSRGEDVLLVAGRRVRVSDAGDARPDNSGPLAADDLEVARRIGRELAWIDGPFPLKEARAQLAYRRMATEPGPLLLEVGLGWCDGRHVTSADFEGEPGIDLTTLSGPSSAPPAGAGGDDDRTGGDDGTVGSDAVRALDGRAVFGPGGVG